MFEQLQKLAPYPIPGRTSSVVYVSDMTSPLSPLDPRADRLLELCRELRILDDGVIGARQELDEIASLVVRSHPLDMLPEELRDRLRSVTATLDDREQRRAVVRKELDTLDARIAETVPVRVV